jgi:periplasmic protein TonB
MQSFAPNPPNKDPNAAKVVLGPGVRNPKFAEESESWASGFFGRLKGYFTERPIKVSSSLPTDLRGDSYGQGGFWDNLKAAMQPVPKEARGPVRSRMVIPWRSSFATFRENLRDLISPPKLPPLKVTSKPVKVKEIWSKDEKFGVSQLSSLLVHGALIVLIAVPVLFPRILQTTEAKNKPLVTDIDVSPYLAKLPPGDKKAGGGGGGGERMNTPPTKGKAPKFDWIQKTPPMAVIRNPQPKLPAEPTLLGPPDLKVPSPNMANYGDPLARVITGSGGPGGGGGIGTGCCGGIGSGDGGGLGPGSGGGTGGGAFSAGRNGVGYPACTYCPPPTYSEEARKAKYQGVVVLQITVTPDGRAIDIQVVRGPGLGLEEKAVEAVRGWRFKPASGPGGKPVPTVTQIEVTFRLL